MLYFCCRYLSEDIFWHSTPARLAVLVDAHNRYERGGGEEEKDIEGISRFLTDRRR